MYKVNKPYTVISPIDDAKYTRYGNPDGTGQIIYITDKAFHEAIPLLKGKDVNYEHKPNIVVGKVIDMVHNLEGIETYEGGVIDPKAQGELAKWFAVIEVQPQYFDEIKKIKGISTEIVPLKQVLPNEFDTLPFYSKDNGTIEGGKPDVVFTKIQYTGLAFTDNPRKAVSTILLNSASAVLQPIGFFEKKLDNAKNNNNTQKTILNKMENIDYDKLSNAMMEKLNPMLENACKNAFTNAMTQKNANGEDEKPKDEEKKENSADEGNTVLKALNSMNEKLDTLANAMTKKNAVDEEKKENSADSDEDDKKENSYKNSAGFGFVGNEMYKAFVPQQEPFKNSSNSQKITLSFE